MDAAGEPTALKQDGRRQRGERNRRAIVDATLALIGEGCLAPTAQLISERAGCTIRSLFRHFPDMESLFAEANNEVRRRAVGTFTGGRDGGSIAERIPQVVERYCAGYEQEQNLILMTKGQSWRYAVLRQNYAQLQGELRQNLENWLPEARQLSVSRRELLHAITSFEMWHRLREQHNLSQAEAIALMTEEVNTLLDCR